MIESKQEGTPEPVTISDLPRRPQPHPRLSTTSSSPAQISRVDDLCADIVNLLDSPVSPLTSTPTSSLRSFSSSLTRSITKNTTAKSVPTNTSTPHYPSHLHHQQQQQYHHPAPNSTLPTSKLTATVATIDNDVNETMKPGSPDPENAGQKYKPYRRSEVPSIPGGRVVSPLGSPRVPGTGPSRGSIGVQPMQIESLRNGLQGMGIQNSPPGPSRVANMPYGSTPGASTNPRASSSATTAVMRDDRIVVGIDFGTTHSAVAWAHTSSPDDYEVITQWPGQVGKDWGKVPSDISYHPIRNSTNEHSSNSSNAALTSGNVTTGRDGTPLFYKWGFEVQPNDQNKFSWVKVLLDPSQPRPDFVNPKPSVLPYGKPPVEIVTDYLTALKNYTLLTLERRFGKDWLYGVESQQYGYMDPPPSKKVEFVLTVPAVWSDKARQMTLEAAIRAGLGTYPVTGNEEGSLPSSPIAARPPSLPPIIPSPSLTATEFQKPSTGPSDVTKRRSFTTSSPLRLITEPEGAAEYALRSISEIQTSNLKPNDVFIVLDAGGGTVDLISYRITALTPKLQLDECVVGTGALCGAVYLDRRFEEFVQLRIGHDVYNSMSLRALQQMWGYWETFVKREFRGVENEFNTPPSSNTSLEDGGVKVDSIQVYNDGISDDGEAEDFFVPLPGVADNRAIGLQESFLRLSRREVSEIFEPVVQKVLELLSGQILAVLKSPDANVVSCILLVGGFGSSEYLYKRIQKFLRQSTSLPPQGMNAPHAHHAFNSASGKIQVIQPRNAWTAVVRGAIIRGLMSSSALPDRDPTDPTKPSTSSILLEKGAIRNRLSRRWYGVAHDVKWEEGRFDENEKKWHELRCEWVVRDRLKWYIKKGQTTSSDTTISFPFYRTIPVIPIQKNIPPGASAAEQQKKPTPPATHQILKTELWTCELDNAPNKRDASVHKLAVMTSEPIPVERFQKSRNEKGEEFYRVDYTLDMTVLSGNVVYEMRLQNTVDAKGGRVERGVRVGRVEVRYEDAKTA